MSKITRREHAAIIQSLGAGVVPRIGLHHIQVGRKDEVEAILQDINRVTEGGSSIRFVIGRFGSGKTFFLNLIRTVALERQLVTVHADITPDRRLHGTGGKAQTLLSELVNNLATRSRPEGSALGNVLERWIGEINHQVRQGGGSDEDVQREIAKSLEPLRKFVGGFDFELVIGKYYEGYLTHNDELQRSALRWLRAEYTTKSEARSDLGVRRIIDDALVYDYLKLLAAFVRIAGYSGLLVCVDELVVLSHRLKSAQARNNNYEVILHILNDCLQGSTQGLAFLFAGTDDCLQDPRRGIFSYEALATRLAPSRFATTEYQDFSSPVLRLGNLLPEDCWVLLSNIRRVFANGTPEHGVLPDEGITQYLKSCNERMGAAYFQTPRDTVKDFVGLLRVLEQHPDSDWRKLLQVNAKDSIKAASAAPGKPHDDLSEFRL